MAVSCTHKRTSASTENRNTVAAIDALDACGEVARVKCCREGSKTSTLEIGRLSQTEDTTHSRAAASRLPIVGVMGSGASPHRHRAKTLGEWLATQPVHLLTGGGGGVMKSVCAAFASVEGRQGKIIGILPGGLSENEYKTLPGYPNQWVEIPINTHLPLSGLQGTDLASRNHINVLTSDVIVALPGGHGTASEVKLALLYGKPLVAFLSAREDIPGLPPAVYVEPVFDRVKRFIEIHTRD